MSLATARHRSPTCIWWSSLLPARGKAAPMAIARWLVQGEERCRPWWSLASMRQGEVLTHGKWVQGTSLCEAPTRPPAYLRRSPAHPKGGSPHGDHMLAWGKVVPCNRSIAWSNPRRKSYKRMIWTGHSPQWMSRAHTSKFLSTEKNSKRKGKIFCLIEQKKYN